MPHGCRLACQCMQPPGLTTGQAQTPASAGAAEGSKQLVPACMLPACRCAHTAKCLRSSLRTLAPHHILGRTHGVPRDSAG